LKLLVCCQIPRYERKCWGAREIFSCAASDVLNHWRVTSYPKVSDTLEKSSVVLTCSVSVLQDLSRTKAVLGGLQSVESTQNHGSEKAVLLPLVDRA